MKPFYIVLFLGILFQFNANAQEIKSMPSDISDYIPLLNSAGYLVYAFDISSLKNDTYDITFKVKEYANGELVSNPMWEYGFSLPNRRMIADLLEEQQKQIIAEGSAYDVEKGIRRLSEKITIGFSPVADSLKKVSMSVDNIGKLEPNIALKPMEAPGYEGKYLYDIRPFTLGAITLGEFIPLVLVGSFWYDEQIGFVRFCGEREFSPDMSSETLHLCPHYYVIGISVNKR